MILHPIIDLLKRIVVALPDYAGGGDTGITNGYEILSVDNDNFASKIKVHCDSNALWKYACAGRTYTPWKFVNEWLFPNTVTDFSNNYVFYESGINTMTLLYATNVGQYTFYDCRNLRTVYLPKCATLGSQTFVGGSVYETIQIGSVGYPCTSIHNTAFSNHPYSDTITIYTTSSYVDTAVTNTRHGATHATIIIKAAEETTYNGTTYNAGDTILTSEVTP